MTYLKIQKTNFQYFENYLKNSGIFFELIEQSQCENFMDIQT